MDAPLFMALAKAPEQSMSNFKPQEIANLGQAFGKLLSEKVHPGELEAFLVHLIGICCRPVLAGGHAAGGAKSAPNHAGAYQLYAGQYGGYSSSGYSSDDHLLHNNHNRTNHRYVNHQHQFRGTSFPRHQQFLFLNLDVNNLSTT